MAKKSDAAYEAFLADLKAINPQIEEIIKDEKVSSKLRDGVLARSEFSSQMDTLRQERDQMNDYLEKEKQKILGWQKWYGEVTQSVSSMQEKLERYAEEYGDLDDAGQRREAKKHGMTVEEFNEALGKELQKRESAYLKFMDDLSDLKIEHRERFKEKLDTDAVYKIAGEKNLPLGVAYDVFIADRVKEQNAKDVEEKIAAARKEGYQEALSKHNLPVLDSKSEMTHVLDAKDVPASHQDRVKAAIDGFYNKR